jgi:hypothetical protein
MTQEQKTNLFKKYAETIVIVSTICGSLIWMNGKFNTIEKDIAIIKTVLIMKNILPSEIAKQE